MYISLNPFDQIYLDTVLKERSKSNFLGYLIPINFAFLTGVYLVNRSQLFYIVYTTEGLDRLVTALGLCLLLLVVNASVACIYLRERNLDQRITTIIKGKFVHPNLSSEPGHLKPFADELVRTDSIQLGETWHWTKIVLSFLVGIPAGLGMVFWSILRDASKLAGNVPDFYMNSTKLCEGFHLYWSFAFLTLFIALICYVRLSNKEEPAKLLLG